MIRWKKQNKKSKKQEKRVVLATLKLPLRWNSMMTMRRTMLKIRMHCRSKGSKIIMIRMTSCLTARRKAAVDRNSLRQRLQSIH